MKIMISIPFFTTTYSFAQLDMYICNKQTYIHTYIQHLATKAQHVKRILYRSIQSTQIRNSLPDPNIPIHQNQSRKKIKLALIHVNHSVYQVNKYIIQSFHSPIHPSSNPFLISQIQISFHSHACTLCSHHSKFILIYPIP
jgi:hypothetical protein